MRSFLEKFERFVARREAVPSTALHIITVIVFVSIVRLGLERLQPGYVNQEFLFTELTNIISFYTALFFLFFRFASLAFPDQVLRVRSIILLALFSVLLPPVITPLFSLFYSAKNLPYDYFHSFSWNFFTSYQPLGESIGLWLTTIGVSAYFWYKKKNFFYCLLGFGGTYAILQFVLWFLTIPASWLYPLLGDVKAHIFLPPFSMDFVLLCVSLFMYIWIRSDFFKATLKRFHHTLVRGVFVIFGAQAAGGANYLTFTEAAIFIIAFMLIQAENDFFDKAIDSVAGRASAITLEDLMFVRYFMLLFVVILSMIQPAAGILLGLFLLLGFFYNHAAFRLKKNFIASSLVEGGLAFSCMLAGIFSVTNTMEAREMLCIAVLALIFAVVSNMKDYKDFTSDKETGIHTLYVALDAIGIPPQKTQAAFTIAMACFSLAILSFFNLFFAFSLPSRIAGGILFLLAPLPLFFINNPKKSLPVSITVVQGGIFLLYAAYVLLPVLL